MKCAVIAFPGNNCEIETARAATRNGFETQIFRWNQIDDFQQFSPDFVILPGGFSFEDRGRSGVLASKEPIFDVLRIMAKKGTIILGICNGAQMIVESALIPAEIALAKNIRRDETGHVLGTGFYNAWVYLSTEKRDSVFTRFLDEKPLHVPMAHGEGRFVSRDKETERALKSGEIVIFRYTDEQGHVSDKFPITPNGSDFATAAIGNKEGTIMAIMPHPERFFDTFDGDKIFQSVYKSLEKGELPTTVVIGEFDKLKSVKVKKIEPKRALWIEKKLIITDNENFSVRTAAQNIVGHNLDLDKTTLFEITTKDGSSLDKETLIQTGLILNPSKEFVVADNFGENKKGLFASDYEDDEADHLAEQLSTLLGKEIHVKIYTGWYFGKETSDDTIEKIISSRLLANPNSAKLFKR